MLGRRAENGRKLIMHLFKSPAITVNQVIDLLGLKYHSANKLVQALVELNILEEITGYQRNRIFLLHQYIDVFRDKQEI
jgi:Fic family protein